jgi:hypothetical protein
MQNRTEFIKLQLASFVSQSGSHFLTIALSAFVLVSSGSVIKSALVFILSFLPSIFFSAKLGNWIDGHLSRWLLARNELMSVGASALCGVCIATKAPLIFLCLVISARSLLLFIARTGGSKWIKVISPPEVQSGRIKLFFLSFFLSTAVAGIMAGTVLGQSSILWVVVIDIATYIASFCLILFLRELPRHAVPEATSVQVVQTVKEILRLPEIRQQFISVCASQAVFQGAYSVLVSYLPIRHFHLGLSGVGVFQFAASIGIILGFAAVSVWPSMFSKEEGSWPFRLVIGLGAGSLLACSTIDFLPTAAFMFFSMHFAYECIWLFNSSEFFRQSPATCLGRYQFTLTACASFIMAVSTLGYSVLITHFGLEMGVLTLMIVGLTPWFLTSRLPAAEEVADLPALGRGNGV